jgi:hypothetical protein
MKADYLQYYRDRGFRGYRSPWVALKPAQKTLLKNGDLVRDKNGVEYPFGEGRAGEMRVDGVKRIFYWGRDTNFDVQFVWVDRRGQDPERYFDDSSQRKMYTSHSSLMGKYLRRTHEIGFNPLGPVQFPLFHETSPENAQNILQNGINILSLISRTFPGGGHFFSMGTSIESVMRKGNFSGAVVKFMPPSENPPFWFNMLDGKYSDQVLMVWFDQALPAETRKVYDWSVICSELSVSALLNGFVMVFDPNGFVPTEVILT